MVRAPAQPVRLRMIYLLMGFNALFSILDFNAGHSAQAYVHFGLAHLCVIAQVIKDRA